MRLSVVPNEEEGMPLSKSTMPMQRYFHRNFKRFVEIFIRSRSIIWLRSCRWPARCIAGRIPYEPHFRPR